ncbi:hypothetical protein NUITMVRA1_08940 [Aerococcus viridans]|uniref:hypothetical protein n=1 Tax=Aerococcus viridans TaxID=1377 RepID=UPI0028FDB829|nr:hypothetical protein NUITMVRA1_08940 [Aerococcus viridans]
MRLVGFKKSYLEAVETTDIIITIDPFTTNHPLCVWVNKARDIIIDLGEDNFYLESANDKTKFTLSLTIQ